MSVPGPLAGILVIDLTRVLAGPFCTMVLADLGARVIKVEAPGRGDDARGIGPFVGGASVYFASLNRGKQSIALDLKDAADRAVFARGTQDLAGRRPPRISARDGSGRRGGAPDRLFAEGGAHLVHAPGRSR